MSITIKTRQEFDNQMNICRNLYELVKLGKATSKQEFEFTVLTKKLQHYAKLNLNY